MPTILTIHGGIPVPADEVRLTADHPESRRRGLIRIAPELGPGWLIKAVESIEDQVLRAKMWISLDRLF